MNFDIQEVKSKETPTDVSGTEDNDTKLATTMKP